MDPKDTDIEMKLTTPSPEVAHAHKQSAKITTLQKSVTTLQSQIDSIQSDLNEIIPKLHNEPDKTVKQHIHLLHSYNEIKDVAQGLMGLLAESRGERIGDVSRSFGMLDKD
ncbi:hypothetical protein N7509_001157 [Penicillium cosmopolitanum]|uniref:Swi5-domain-containing protein n=1 Tax=Penicillium cosmopolitanum TaxID=1131564 RepID=A0A9X0BEU9_9EURO|nr:uncharacterized protein N7509_001157 [Penicillium cosmopolitanum]KAJ5414530.1 hypothetical protein N7509_001157 [Penicillium cosmopolitanum]